MPKSLEVGHVLFVQAAGAFFRIAGVREFSDSLSVVLTAGQTLSNQEATTLKSPTDQIYHLRAIGLEDDVNFTYRWRNAGQVGIKQQIALTIEQAPSHEPFFADLWLYNYSMFYDITENRNLAKTAIIWLYGEVYELEAMDAATAQKGYFAIVEG